MPQETSAPTAHAALERVNLLAVLSVVLGTFLGNLDTSIANVALPTIARDMGNTAAQTVWVVAAYQLAMSVVVMPLAAIAETSGFRRMFLWGMVVFTVASLGCAVAPSLAWLIAVRAVQGIGAAAMSTVVPPLLRQLYPARLIGRGIALLGLVVAVSAALGPTVAAAILSVTNWRWLFAVNVPLGVFGFFIAYRLVPRHAPVAAARGFDYSGAVLSAATIALFILGVGSLGGGAGVPLGGWSIPHLPLLAILIACGAAFGLVHHQRGQDRPLVPLDLLRIRILSLSSLTSICSYIAQTLAYLALPFMLQHQFGRSATETGLLVTPWPLVIVFIAPLAGRLSDRYAPGTIGGIGLAILALGLALLVGMPADPSNADIVWRVVVCGIGFGLFQTPNNRIMVTSAPHDRGGAAGALMTMSRMIGLTLGAALAGLFFEVFRPAGAHVALIGGAVAALLGVIVGVVRVARTG